MALKIAKDLRKLTEREIGYYRQELVMPLGEIDLYLEERRKEKRHIIKRAEIDKKLADIGGFGAVTIMSPELGFNAYNLNTVMVRIPPRTSGETTRYVRGEAVKTHLEGRAIDIVEGDRFEVEPGDVTFIPAGAVHEMQTFDEPVKFVATGMAPGTPVLKPALPPAMRHVETVGGRAHVEGNRGSTPGDVRHLTEREISHRRQELIMLMRDLNAYEDEKRKENRHVMKRAEIEQRIADLPEDQGMVKIVFPELGFNVYNLYTIMTSPGMYSRLPRVSGSSIDHSHGEAVKYFLEGKMIDQVEADRVEVEAGDLTFIPASAWHGGDSLPAKDCKFIAVIMHIGSPVIKPALVRVRGSMAGKYLH